LKNWKRKIKTANLIRERSLNGNRSMVRVMTVVLIVENSRKEGNRTRKRRDQRKIKIKEETDIIKI
jgi:hypothetical protein